MKTKSFLILLIVFWATSNIYSQDSTQTNKKVWYEPDYAKIQFAGNIGFITTGFGYHFFNDKLYTEFLYGHVPRRISKADKIRTITIKNTFPIYRIQAKKYTLTPISGFTVSVETGNNSFISLPSKFPENYYSSNAFHGTLFIGGLAHKDFENKKLIKGIDYYYEIGTVATYLFYSTTQKNVSLVDIFSSAIGINFYF